MQLWVAVGASSSLLILLDQDYDVVMICLDFLEASESLGSLMEADLLLQLATLLHHLSGHERQEVSWRRRQFKPELNVDC